jgi:hypothetical protein
MANAHWGQIEKKRPTMEANGMPLTPDEFRRLLLADDDPIVRRILDEPDVDVILSRDFTTMLDGMRDTLTDIQSLPG